MNSFTIEKIAIGRALSRLRPDSEFSINGKDVSSLIWHSAETEPVTQEELDDMIEVIKAELLSGQ